MANTNVPQEVAMHVGDIKSLPFAKYIFAEDVIERNYGYKIIRQQVSAGKNSLVYKCEKAKFPDVYCLIKAYKLGKDRIKTSLKEETCQILRYVTGKCPQLLSTYDIFYTSEKIYLMCDWSARGEVLANMRKGLKLNEVMLRDWTVDLLSAVNFLHSNAICHRNIAPNCLLLTADSRVKIGTLSDAVIYCKPDGSLIKQKWPKFSRTSNWNQPPEVAKNKLYDPRRADIWSLGSTIYWFITRKYPINYSSPTKLPKQLERNLEHLPKVSKKCQAFVKKLLTYQPPSRPTIMAAQQLEWVSAAGAASTKASPTLTPTPPAAAAASREPTVEIGGAEKAEEPGEAAGPEETQAIEAPETSRKSANGNSPAPPTSEATEKPSTATSEDPSTTQ